MAGCLRKGKSEAKKSETILSKKTFIYMKDDERLYDKKWGKERILTNVY